MAQSSSADDRFNDVFAQFDPTSSGLINTRDFLNLIDELDALQAETADPIITATQRETALQIVEAEVPMSRAEVIEFLEQLGVVLPDIQGSALPNESDPPERHELDRLDMSSVRSDHERMRARDAQENGQRFRRHRLRKAGESDASDTNRHGPGVSTTEQEVLSDTSTARFRRATTPLAQSTPQKNYSDNEPNSEKRNVRPRPVTGNSQRHASYSALGQGPPSPATATVIRPNSSDNHDSEENARLQEHIKLLQDRERGSERVIATNEEQIQDLQLLLYKNSEEMQNTKKVIADLQTSLTTTESTMHHFEAELHDAHQSIDEWRKNYEHVKHDLETQTSIVAKLSLESQEKVEELYLMKQKVANHELDVSKWKNDKFLLQAQITKLEARSAELTHVESDLQDALKRCSQSEEQVDRLLDDLKSMRQASDKSRSTQKHSGAGTSFLTDEMFIQAERITTSRETQTDEASDQRAPKGVLESTQASISGAAEDTIQKHYANLSNEIGFQRDLIDKMIKMRSNMKKSKARARAPIATVQKVPDVPPNSFRIPNSYMTWLTLMLYSLVFLLLGYILSRLISTKAAPGVSYAETWRWKRANTLNDVYTFHGVLDSSLRQRWWENNWWMIERCGYWLEQKLIEEPWPS